MKQRVAAIVLAAGKGTRMQSKVHKQFLLLDGKPLLWYSLQAFEQSQVQDVILVTGEESVEYCQKEVVERFDFQKVRAVTAGGKERYHSVYAGLNVLLKECRYGAEDFVMIHDGARPFADADLIERIRHEVQIYGACVAGMPSKDTIKISDEEGFAVQTPKRQYVWTIQTPQAFSYSLIKGAYDKMMEREDCQQGITDDAMVVERMTDKKVRLTEGSYRNIKVTTPEDMVTAEAFLAEKRRTEAEIGKK